MRLSLDQGRKRAAVAVGRTILEIAYYLIERGDGNTDRITCPVAVAAQGAARARSVGGMGATVSVSYPLTTRDFQSKFR
jgi:hypothetical protein